MRVPQPAGLRGSLKWVQRLIEQHSPLVETMLRRALVLTPSVTFDWRSPRCADDWAEYRDGRFLERIDQADLKDALAQFWPARGPQWDGLALTSDRKVLLFEGKAHIPELKSSCSATSKASRRHIETALALAKAHFGTAPDVDWLCGFYQYANRLAHLWFLRSHGIDAHLVFLYFTHDQDMNGPTSRKEWNDALRLAYAALGLDQHRQIPCVHSLFIDVRDLTGLA